MSQEKLGFTRQQAFRYQQTLIKQNLEHERKVLKILQQHQEDVKALAEFLKDSPNGWQPMLQFLKIPKEDVTKKIQLQTLFVEFIRLKKGAMELLLLGSKDPELWAVQHFHEEKCAEELVAASPSHGQNMMKEFGKRIQMERLPDQPDEFQVVS